MAALPFRGLEKWVEGNLMEFKKQKCKVLHVGRNNPSNNTGLGLTSWKADLPKRTWGSWWTAS